MRDGELSLVEALHKEKQRVLDLKDLYVSLPGRAGWHAASCMQVSGWEADAAAESGDVVRMLVSLKELESYE